MNIDFLNKDKFCNTRSGETRFWESALWVGDEKTFDYFIHNSNIPFCIVGIPEDIGIRANLGRPGAWSAFEPSLQTLCNIQKNPYLNSALCALGFQVHTKDLMNEAKNTSDLNHLREIVKKLDDRVEHFMKLLFIHKKVPIVIGGGHNNALPIIRALNKATQKKINILNIDAHTDLRHVHEGRHSGNSFSFAFKENLLEKYFVLGYQENYLPDYVYQLLKEKKDCLSGISFEELKVKNATPLPIVFKKILSVFKKPCGLELDMDSIIHVPSSARTSSGFSPEEVRNCIFHFSEHCKPHYFHICEAAPVLAHRNADNRTGKLISFLITDFIKGYLN